MYMFNRFIKKIKDSKVVKLIVAIAKTIAKEVKDLGEKIKTFFKKSNTTVAGDASVIDEETKERASKIADKVIAVLGKTVLVLFAIEIVFTMPLTILVIMETIFVYYILTWTCNKLIIA